MMDRVAVLLVAIVAALSGVFAFRQADQRVARAEQREKAVEVKAAAYQREVAARQTVVSPEVVSVVNDLVLAAEHAAPASGGPPPPVVRTAFVYLGMCQAEWIKPNFSGMHGCKEPLPPDGLGIVALRDMTLRDGPPPRIGEFAEPLGAIRRGSRATLRALYPMPWAAPGAPQIYWGKITVSH